MAVTHISSFSGGTNFATTHAETGVACGSGANRVAYVLLGRANQNTSLPVSCTVGTDTLTARGAGTFVDGSGRHWRLYTGALTVTGTQTVTGTWDTDFGFALMIGVVLQVPNGADHFADLVTGSMGGTTQALTIAAAAAGDGLLLANAVDGVLTTPTAPTVAFPTQDGVNGTPAPIYWQAMTRPIASSGSVAIGGTSAASSDWRGVAIRVPAAADTTPPIITGPAGATGATSSISLAENTTAVHTFTANESVTWSINGGADAARFTIGSGTGALVFATAPNFESPTDADTNNTYIVGVRATDTAGNATTQTCTVTVVNANEAPSFAGPSIANLSGTVGDAIPVTNLATRFTDPDSGDTGTYTTGGSWPSGPVLTSAGVLQGVFPAAGTYGSLTVIRTDASSLTATSNAFSITASAPVTPTATLNGALDSITGNLSATAVQGRLTSALPLRDAARVVLANRSDVAVHVQAIATLTSVALLSAQSITSGIWTAVGPFVPGTTYAVIYGVGGTRIGCEIITATAP